jgi:hypothetical protein
VALVLSAERSASYVGALHWQLGEAEVAAPALRSAVARALQSNPMSAALPLFESLAADDMQALALALPGTRHLALRHHRLSPEESSTP